MRASQSKPMGLFSPVRFPYSIPQIPGSVALPLAWSASRSGGPGGDVQRDFRAMSTNKRKFLDLIGQFAGIQVFFDGYRGKVLTSDNLDLHSRHCPPRLGELSYKCKLSGASNQ